MKPEFKKGDTLFCEDYGTVVYIGKIRCISDKYSVVYTHVGNIAMLTKDLFFKSQITTTKREYVCQSVCDKPIFEGDQVWVFNKDVENMTVQSVLVHIELTGDNNYSKPYLSKPDCEAARKKHFVKETFPLPDWFNVQEEFRFGEKDETRLSVRIDNSEFYQSCDWEKRHLLDKVLETLPAHLELTKISEIKEGDFFIFNKDDSRLILIGENGNGVMIKKDLSYVDKTIISDYHKDVKVYKIVLTK